MEVLVSVKFAYNSSSLTLKRFSGPLPSSTTYDYVDGHRIKLEMIRETLLPSTYSKFDQWKTDRLNKLVQSVSGFDFVDIKRLFNLMPELTRHVYFDR